MGVTVTDNEFYKSERTFLISSSGNVTITEYDIRAGNINVLYRTGAIDLDLYSRLLAMDKYNRVWVIGNMMRDNPTLQAQLKEGFRQARNEFAIANSIQDSDILMIMRDALYIINRDIQRTVFDNVQFVEKNRYSSYMNLRSNLQLLYNRSQNRVDVKGINDAKLSGPMRPLILDFIKLCFELAEDGRKDELFTIFKNFHKAYRNRAVDVEYYRELNADCAFSINPMTPYGSPFSIPVLPDISLLPLVNISYNSQILSTVWSILTKYFGM